jgi:hypothetical protein
MPAKVKGLTTPVLSVGLLWITSAFAAFDSGNSLFDSCNNASDASKQSHCLAYIAGVSDVLDGMHITCTGGHVSLDEVKDVVVKYLREHPEQRNSDADDSTSIALTLAFPCK